MVRLTTFYVWIVFRLSDRSRRGYFSYVHFELRMLSEVELFLQASSARKFISNNLARIVNSKFLKEGFS